MTRRKRTAVTLSTMGWPAPAPHLQPRDCIVCADLGIYRVETQYGVSHWCAPHLPEQYRHRVGGGAQ